MGFWLRHTSLGKVGNPISPCLMRKQSGISPNLRTGSNWSRDTVQPMRRRACVYQIIDPVIKNFDTSRQSWTDFKIRLQCSSGFHIISKKTIEVRAKSEAPVNKFII